MSEYFTKSELPKRLWFLAAKASREYTRKWLPLWMHLADTAGIMQKLIRHWIPSSSIRAIGLSDEELDKIVVFLGLTHDIGKSIPLFQRKISMRLDGLIERLQEIGFFVPPIAEMDVTKSPHAMAGQIILRFCGCPPGVATVVGAHHGKPQKWVNPDEHMRYYFANYGIIKGEKNGKMIDVIGFHGR